MNINQRIAMNEKGLSVKRLGQILDKHPGYVSSVLSGRYYQKELRQKIASVLGKSEAYLWPEPDIVSKKHSRG